MRSYIWFYSVFYFPKGDGGGGGGVGGGLNETYKGRQFQTSLQIKLFATRFAILDGVKLCLFLHYGDFKEGRANKNKDNLFISVTSYLTHW